MDTPEKRCRGMTVAFAKHITMCVVLYVCRLIEFLQQAALGKLFNYCHFADEVIGP